MALRSYAGTIFMQCSSMASMSTHSRKHGVIPTQVQREQHLCCYQGLKEWV